MWGEPLSQADFVLELCRKLKEVAIHCVLDTCDMAMEDLKQILEYTDLVFWDIKCMDDAKHKEWTGVSNAKILEI